MKKASLLLLLSVFAVDILYAAHDESEAPAIARKRGVVDGGRLGQGRICAESPRRWFLEKDVKWKRREKCEDGTVRNVPEVNTNAALYGFLGAKFGTGMEYPCVKYVKLDKPFWGFSWIRMDSSPGYCPMARCDASMSFRTAGRSTVPVRRMKALRDFFADRYGVEYIIESENSDCFFAAGVAGEEYHVSVYATNFVEKSSDSQTIVYEIGFEVVNEICIAGSDNRTSDSSRGNWKDALHITDIAEADLERDSAWRYVAVKGKTAEELLDDWIKTGDDGPLIVPGKRYKIGTPISMNRRDGYFCPEWEADIIHSVKDGWGGFIKFASREVQKRIAAKLYHPSFFRPRKAGVYHHYYDGVYIGEIVPGDKITWTDKDSVRREGIVCDTEGEGEYVEKFKCRIKTVKMTEMARPCDYLPSQLSSNYMAAARSVYLLLDEYRAEINRVFGKNGTAESAPADYCKVIGKYLSKLHEQIRPGRHISINYNGLEIPTREAARRSVRYRERHDLVRWQDAVDYAISDVLGYIRTVFRWNPNETEGDVFVRKRIVLTDELCEIMGLSAYERKLATYDKYWRGGMSTLNYKVGEPRIVQNVFAPHLPAVGRVPESYPYKDFIVSGQYDVPSVVDALSSSPLTNELEIAFAVWTAVGTCISSGMAKKQKEDAVVAFAGMLVQRGSPLDYAWTTWRLAVEYGDLSILPWTFLHAVVTGVRGNELSGDRQAASRVEVFGRPIPYKRQTVLKAFFEWTKRAFGSAYFKTALKNESEDSIHAWERKLKELTKRDELGDEF